MRKIILFLHILLVTAYADVEYERYQRAEKKLKEQCLSFLEKDNGEIVRKEHSKAWKKYRVDSTIKALYAKAFTKHADFKVQESIAKPYMVLSPTFPIKSMAILQKSDYDPMLIAFFNVSNEALVKYRLKLMGSCVSKEIYVFIEDIKGEILLWKIVKFIDTCEDGSSNDDYMHSIYKRLRYEHTNSVNKIKYNPSLKIRRLEEGLLKVDLRFTNKIVSYTEAKKKEVSVEFISHIKATLNGKVVYDCYLSPFIQYQRTKFYIKNAKEGDKITVFMEDIHGQKIYRRVVIGEKSGNS